VPRQHDHVELQVVTELANRWILEQRTQPLQRCSQVELVGSARAREQISTTVFAFVSDRNIACLTVAGGKRKADHTGAHGRRLARNDAQRELTGGAQSGDERIQFGLGVDDRVILLNVLGRRRVVVDQRPEGESREQFVAALTRGAAVLQRLEVHLHGYVGANRDELPALERGCSMRDQRLTLFGFELCSVFEQPIEAAELGDQVDRALLADTGNAGDVVARIADKRQHVRDL
jgi:hypothetical protein